MSRADIEREYDNNQQGILPGTTPEKDVQNILETNAIIVTLVGGLVQDINNIPPGISVEVWDFDVEDFVDEDNELSYNTLGEPFFRSIYDSMLYSVVLVTGGIPRKVFPTYSYPVAKAKAEEFVKSLDCHELEDFSVQIFDEHDMAYLPNYTIDEWAGITREAEEDKE